MILDSELLGAESVKGTKAMITALKKINPRIRSRYFQVRHKYFNRFAFVHINKCGGTSIEKFLGIPKKHETAQQIINEIGFERWKSIYSFSVIRHPYSKVVSHYKYRTGTNQTELGENSIDINTWIKLSYGEKHVKYYDNPLMFAPCLHWITLGDEIIVDRVTKLEKLNEEWESICLDIGKKFSPLPHANKTSSSDIDSAYSLLNCDSLKIIKDHFQQDFIKFNYDY